MKNEEQKPKCKCGRPVWGQYGEWSRCKDCLDSSLDAAEKAIPREG